MRYTAAVLICVVLACLTVQAADVSLAWDPSVSANIAGYKVYLGKAPRVYDQSIPISNQTTYTVSSLRGPATFYFAVTAYDTDGNESDFSNEVSAQITGIEILPVLLHVPIIPPIGPRIIWHAVTAMGTVAATIAWQTNEECSGILLWGTDPSRLTAKVSNNQGTYDHLVNLTGLLSRTRYTYQLESVCGTTDIKSPVYSFNTKAQ